MKKKSKLFKVVLGVFLVAVVFLGGVFGYIYSKIKNVKKVNIPKGKAELSINEKAEEKSKLNKVTNIAFFGIDTREKGGSGRSDSIMVITVDGKHDKIKMSSIMRDTYVDIDGHGKTKLNHAYAYGGPQLAIKTINQNFDLDIKDFVTVDFFELADIIDTLGGVEIDVKQDEIKHINSYNRELAKLSNKPAKKIDKPGVYNLTGAQAVAYCRIRYTNGGDYMRTERQRTVLNALFNKGMAMNKTELLNVIPQIASKVQTSMSNTDMIKIGMEVFTSNIRKVEQKRFPLDENAKGKTIDKVWYLITDIDATKKAMNDFIFEN